MRDGDTLSNLYLTNYLGDKLLVDEIISINNRKKKIMKKVKNWCPFIVKLTYKQK